MERFQRKDRYLFRAAYLRQPHGIAGGGHHQSPARYRPRDTGRRPQRKPPCRVKAADRDARGYQNREHTHIFVAASSQKSGQRIRRAAGKTVVLFFGPEAIRHQKRRGKGQTVPIVGCARTPEIHSPECGQGKPYQPRQHHRMPGADFLAPPHPQTQQHSGKNKARENDGRQQRMQPGGPVQQHTRHKVPCEFPAPAPVLLNLCREHGSRAAVTRPIIEIIIDPGRHGAKKSHHRRDTYGGPQHRDISRLHRSLLIASAPLPSRPGQANLYMKLLMYQCVS